MNIRYTEKFKCTTKKLGTLGFGDHASSPLIGSSLTDPGSVYNDTNCISKAPPK
jgi:hypothetical protein